VVSLPGGGTFILPFDAADLRENWDDEILPGESCDDEAAKYAIERLKSIEGTVLFFHDPVAIQSMRLSPECYS
jgi:N-acyl homoserine lactone hydrolase